MSFDLLISSEQLQTLLQSKVPVRVFDCSFELSDPAWGHQRYAQAHIPGAVYADLDKNLSDKNGTGASGGRHPLPQREAFATWLSNIGLANDMQAVVYDRNNANYCGRLWWMLKWAGHAHVAVLDGGLQAWQAFGGQVTAEEESSHFQSNFALAPALVDLVAIETVASNLGRPEQTLIDARGAARFRGEVEPLDPVAGHIPGALNRPFAKLDVLTNIKGTLELQLTVEVAVIANLMAFMRDECPEALPRDRLDLDRLSAADPVRPPEPPVPA